MKDIEPEIYLKLAREQLNEILDDIDDELISRGRIKNEVRETISQLNMANREDRKGVTKNE